jgi:hypothetical protein
MIGFLGQIGFLGRSERLPYGGSGFHAERLSPNQMLYMLCPAMRTRQVRSDAHWIPSPASKTPERGIRCSKRAWNNGKQRARSAADRASDFGLFRRMLFPSRLDGHAFRSESDALTERDGWRPSRIWTISRRIVRLQADLVTASPPPDLAHTGHPRRRSIRRFKRISADTPSPSLLILGANVPSYVGRVWKTAQGASFQPLGEGRRSQILGALVGGGHDPVIRLHESPGIPLAELAR